MIREPLQALSTVLSAQGLRRSLAAFLLFNTAEWAVWVAALVYAYDHGGTTAAAAISVLQLLPAALVAPFAATLGDRGSREQTLGWSYALQAAALSLAVAAFATRAPAPFVFAAIVIVSVTISVSRPIYFASLPAFATSPAELTAANSVATLIENVGMLIGPAIAALVTESTGSIGVFALFAIGQLFAVWLVRVPDPVVQKTAGRIVPMQAPRPAITRSEWLAALRELRKRSEGLLLITYLGGAYLLVGMADVLSVVLSFEILALGPSGPGTVVAAMGFGGIAGAAASILLAGRRRLGPAIAGALLLAGVPFALAGQTNHLAPALLLLALAGAGKSFLDVAARTLLQRSVDDDVLARVFGIQESMMLLALASGAFVVPILVAMLGPRGAFTAAGLVLPVLGLVTWRRLRMIDAEAGLVSPAVERLRSVPIFGHLPVPVLERIGARLTAVDLAPGEIVIREGEPGDRYYIVEAGELAVTVAGVTRPSLGPGDAFGEIALLYDLPRTATVTALTPVRLFALERSEFLAVMTGSAEARLVARKAADTRLGTPDPT
ncbi:MAG TPA: MFS transporter [Steroidobacteraceae bacterium]|nr:MFS transporter [Steroidobacteraceae bacterium]